MSDFQTIIRRLRVFPGRRPQPRYHCTMVQDSSDAVCRGDTIIVDLKVHLPGHAEAIHWHGLPQEKTPWFDGVALVTQCPDNPTCDRYDVDVSEHVIILQDWMHVPAEFVFPGLATRLTGQPADCILINGQGTYTVSSARDGDMVTVTTTVTRPSTGNTTLTPYATFEIESGLRYRFRIINAGSLSCPIQIQFEGHTMNIISADGLDINSGFSEQRALLIYKGAKARLPPTAPPAVRKHVQLPNGTVVNPPGDCDEPGKVCAAELSAANPPETYSTQPRTKAQKLIFFRLKFNLLPLPELFDGNDNDYEKFISFGRVNLAASLNGIAYSDPSAPFLTQPGKSSYCSEGRLPMRCKNETVCDCPHLVKVAYGRTIDVIVVDDTDITPEDDTDTLLGHPMHLHGTSFSCMGMGTLRNITSGAARSRAVRELYNRRALPTYVPQPVLKDVLVLPGGGWIWFRFKATNRGAWFFHCHFQYHMASGMEAVIQVGESRALPKPPANFPQCGDFYG
ncbi:hypothetical protein FOCC_FOCC001628 [Frankliniella occidentalis]|nr:hypothetical protein FOCC_FOCC001628 [Frankliniella occidentalis]